MRNISREQMASEFKVEEFPRSSSYDPEWVIENMMGPNALWLTESLSQVMDLEPGMRVLGMGCGKAISSIFLVQELDLQVWATDLWIDPGDNLERIRATGLESQVFPVRARPTIFPSAAVSLTPSSAWTHTTILVRTISTLLATSVGWSSQAGR